MHQIDDLITLFDNTFYQSHNTRLVKGNDEPIYLPADEQCDYHRIVFAHGFYASALHEIAHWLVAGKARRQQEDYGYWYCPDGRNSAQQQAFEQAELKPQAIEWLLSRAANKPFSVSVDNLNGEQSCRFTFQTRVYKTLTELLTQGLNPRTCTFLQVLCQFYRQPYPLTLSHIDWQPQKEYQDAI